MLARAGHAFTIYEGAATIGGGAGHNYMLTLDATDIDAKREFCRQAGIVLQNRMRWAIIAMREEFIGALDPHPLECGDRQVERDSESAGDIPCVSGTE